MRPPSRGVLRQARQHEADGIFDRILHHYLDLCGVASQALGLVESSVVNTAIVLSFPPLYMRQVAPKDKLKAYISFIFWRASFGDLKNYLGLHGQPRRIGDDALVQEIAKIW